MAKPSTPIKKKPAPKKPAAPAQAAAAFDRALPEIDALSPDRLITINLDIPRAVSQVLGVLPGLLALRPAIAEQFQKHDIARLDRLEAYALAAWHAHLVWLSSRDPESALKPLLAEAVPLREELLSDAEALARRGLLPRNQNRTPACLEAQVVRRVVAASRPRSPSPRVCLRARAATAAPR